MSEDVKRYQSTTPRPSDFDSFWAATRADLEKVPLSLSIERSTLRSTPEADAYEAIFASLSGARVFAWICVPTGGGRHPAILQMPGYSGSPGLPRAWAKL